MVEGLIVLAIIGVLAAILLPVFFPRSLGQSTAIERPIGITIGRVCSIEPCMDFTLCGIKQTGDAGVSLSLKVIKPEHMQVLESNLIKQSTCLFRYTGASMGRYGELVSIEPVTINER